MHDVEENRCQQQQPGDPVDGHPGELDPDHGEKGRHEQGEHRDGHQPVKQSRTERMALDLFRETGRSGRRVAFLRPHNHADVDRVPDDERHTEDHCHPHQAPGDPDQHLLAPRIRRGPEELHVMPPFHAASGGRGSASTAA